MVDKVTIVAVHVTHQRGDALLNIAQGLGLDAAPDFFQRVDEARQLVRRDLSVQR
jgi:hypothetical protein